MELAGLEPATSWVRYRWCELLRSPSVQQHPLLSVNNTACVRCQPPPLLRCFTTPADGVLDNAEAGRSELTPRTSGPYLW
jgi:hypothetical protein